MQVIDFIYNLVGRGFIIKIKQSKDEPFDGESQNWTTWVIQKEGSTKKFGVCVKKTWNNAMVIDTIENEIAKKEN